MEAGLAGRIVLPKELPGRRHIFNQYVLRFESRATRDHVMAHLKTAGIGCEIYYPRTLPQQECFRDTPGADQPFPNSEQAAEQTLAIPVYPELTGEQMTEVVSAIRTAIERAG